MSATMTEAHVDHIDSDSATSVLIADSFSDRGVTDLQQRGCDVHLNPKLSGDALAQAVEELQPEVLIVRSTKVPKPVFEVGNSLGLVIRAGAGYDTIDVSAASARGIAVANCPGMNAIAVAELTWGLILACDRNIPDQCADLRNGVWAKKRYAKASGLHGRTLGIIGMGRIGAEVAARARAFGMHVLAWSRQLDSDRAAANGIIACSDPHSVASGSDIVSIHVASTPETKHLVNAEFLAAMKDGATLINTTRGAVVDEQALSDAITSKGIRAGLDVYESEPASGDDTFSNPLIDLPGVYGTHHVGASTNQAQEAIANEAIRILLHWMSTGEVVNCVNLATTTPASATLTVRHLNQPGVLAHVFDVLGQGGHNVEEMENVIYSGGEAAVARIQLGAPPTAEQVERIRDHDAILTTTTTLILPL